MNLTIAAILMAATAVTNVQDKANVAVTNAPSMAKITSDKAYYDHQEGFACFNGNVSVEDADYQLHSDRAYVFMGATNELRKVVALGNVAMTNGLRRAYGAKASYYRKTSLVVLTADDETPAEVWEKTSAGERLVRGKKIRFWTTARQVEVEEAWIETPRTGMSKDGLKAIMGK